MWIVTVTLFIMAFAIVAFILSAYTRRIAEVALTEKFRAAETITEGGVPGEWIATIKRRIARKGMMRFLTGEVSGQQLALAKLDKLCYFYEHSPFFQNEDSRRLLLRRLQETREQWAGATWEELAAASGKVADSGARAEKRDTIVGPPSPPNGSTDRRDMRRGRHEHTDVVG